MEQIHETHKKPSSFYLLALAMLFQGLSGVAGGIGLVSDPSGSSLSIPLEWLQGSPFDSYFIPGLILLFALGILPLLVTYAIMSHQPWAWITSLLVGLILVIWIGVEILIIGYQPTPPLQIIYGLLGVGIITILLLPSLKQYMNDQSQ